MRSHYRVSSLVLLAVLFPITAFAQCDEAALLKGTIGDAYNCFFANQPKPLEQTAKEMEPMKDSMQDANNPTTAPDPFAGKLHANYQDFFNLLSFAINQVEESKDGQALIMRFNPLRRGRNLLGLTLTVAKPALNTDLVEKLPADKRPAVTAELNKQLDDTDDLTWAASYSLQSGKCDKEKLSTSLCWGRAPATYRQALSFVLAEVSRGGADDSSQQQLFQEIVAAVPNFSGGDLFRLSLPSLTPDQQKSVLDRLQRAAARDAQAMADNQVFFQKSGIGHMATLFDNQPQFAITGTYRDLGRLGGGDELAGSLEFQFGATNLGTVFRDCKGDTSCIAAKLQGFNAPDSTLSTDKFVLTASWKQRDQFEVTDLDLPADLVTFAGLDLKETTELKVHLQWGRQIQANLLGASGEESAGTPPSSASPKKARWDLALDGVRNTEGIMRTKNRWVASWTLSMPFREQVTFPVTVTWANKPEFLTDQRERFGVHFGISYRLPWEGPRN